MRIYVASEADIPAMHRIRMSVRENQLSDPSLVQPRDYRSMLAEHGRGWVAEVDGRVAGFAIADRTRSNVWALFVDPTFEGRGIGGRLHDAMLDWLFAAGTQLVWLNTDPGTRAEHFYQAAGWHHTGLQANGEARYEMSREQWLSRSLPPRTTGTNP